jgi:hypothetical protein
MKKITTATGKFGPYNSIEILSDRFHVDGGDLPFTVIGQGEITDVVDGDFPPPPPPYDEPEVVEALAPTNDELMNEIAVLTAKIAVLTAKFEALK